MRSTGRMPGAAWEAVEGHTVCSVPDIHCSSMLCCLLSALQRLALTLVSEGRLAQALGHGTRVVQDLESSLLAGLT